MLWRISATNKQCMSSALTVDFTQITTPSWCHRQICTLLYNFAIWGRYLNARVMWSQLPVRIPQGTSYIDCSIASAWQIEILQFCTKQSIFSSQILTAVRTFVFEAVNFPVFFFNICFAFAMSLFETTILSVHPIKHAQGFAAISFVVVLLSISGERYNWFTLILQSCFTGTGTILWHLMRLGHGWVISSHKIY